MKSKKTKKILCGLLALAMTFSMAGCKGGNNSAENEDKITLTWVMQGPGKQTDSQRVWTAVNEKLKTYEGLSNVELDLVLIPGSDYKQKVMLMQTSEEKMDILGTYGLKLGNEVRKNNTFLDITNLIDEYAPNIRKEIPEWVMKLTQIDGKQYTIPNYQQMAEPLMGYKFDKKNYDKYMDKEALEKAVMSSDILNKETLDVLEDYLLKLKEAGVMNLGFKPTEGWTFKGYGKINNSLTFPYRYESDKVVVETLLERDVYKLYAQRMTEWYKKGLIRKDVLSAELSQGHYDVDRASYHEYINYNLNNGLPEDEHVVVIRTEKNFRGPTTSTAGGNGITRISQHPNEAMKLLNLMYTKEGKDLYRLLVFGFEGEHYNKISEDRIEATGYSSSQDGKYGLDKWLVGNTAQAFETTSDPEGWNDYVFNDWNVNVIQSKLLGLEFDTTSISNELGQISDTCSSWNDRLMGGSIKDWEKNYKEGLEKLKVAGRDKVVNELQRQVDEFLGQ